MGHVVDGVGWELRCGVVRWSGGVWRGRGWRVLVSGGTVCAWVARCSWVLGVGGRGGGG